MDLAQAPNNWLGIDPNEKSTNGAVNPGVALPEGVRTRNQIPNLKQLQEGDLLLFNDLSLGRMSKAIIQAQLKAGFPFDCAAWHHAAVYIGRGRIVEAELAGVKYLIYLITRQPPEFECGARNALQTRAQANLSLTESVDCDWRLMLQLESESPTPLEPLRLCTGPTLLGILDLIRSQDSIVEIQQQSAPMCIILLIFY
ncbi:MAG: hypothetical protein NBV67_13655 [Tagaea sp.]|nr:hypothetical protein [Tagaea sp.]